jgi:hypothetical protein
MGSGTPFNNSISNEGRVSRGEKNLPERAGKAEGNGRLKARNLRRDLNGGRYF